MKILNEALIQVGELSAGDKSAFENVGSPSRPTLLNTMEPVNKPQPIIIPPAEDPLLHYMSSVIMRDGKRTKADRTISRMLLHIHAMTRAPPLPIVREAVISVSPLVKCVSQRKSVKVIQKPIALTEKRRTRFAVDWLVRASRNRKEQTMEERLAKEIIGVLQGTSEALKKREEMHKLAMVNR